MIRKPTSGDSDQREREADRARKHSEISPAGGPQEAPVEPDENRTKRRVPDRTEGESAHGAIPRRGIDSEHNG